MVRLSKLYFVLSLLLMAVLFSCETQGPDNYKNQYIKYFGGDGDQEARDFVVNSDGSVVMLGTSYETNGDRRLYIVKADANGNQLWGKKLGSTSEFAQDIELITNGIDADKLVILSNVRKNSLDSTAIRLTIINQEGDSLKSKWFNTLESQRGVSVTPLSDGGYYIVGNTTNTDAALNTDLPVGVIDTEDELMIKFEANWDINTFYQIGRSSVVSGIKLFQVGSDFYYAGYWDAIEQPGGTNEPNFFFRKFSDNPLSVSTVYVGAKDEDEYLSAIARGNVGGYLAVGTKVAASRSIVAARINSSFSTAGSLQLVETNAEAVAVTSSQFGGFFVLGNKIGVGGVRNISLIKVDADGNNSYQTEFGASNNDDTGSAVFELSNGDVLVLGTMELVNQRKMALIKTKPNGSF